MSYEYLIVNKNPEIESLFDLVAKKIIENENVEVSVLGGVIDVKDLVLKGTWKYDMRLIRCARDISVILVGWSNGLYDALRFSMTGVSYEIFDEDSEAAISIEEMFRIV